MIILQVTKNQGIALSPEDAFLEIDPLLVPLFFFIKIIYTSNKLIIAEI